MRRSKFHGSNCCPVFRLTVYLCYYRGMAEQAACLLTSYKPHEPRTVMRYVRGPKNGASDYAKKRERLGLKQGLLPAVAKHFGLSLLPGEAYEESSSDGNDCPEPLYSVGDEIRGSNGTFRCSSVTECSCEDHCGLNAVLVRVATRSKRKTSGGRRRRSSKKCKKCQR